MKEYLYYIDLISQSHFVHEHKPQEIIEIPYLFLNPIFDEKKRSQRFYAETARRFCEKGIPVIRFDYYGTGDSYGQLFELDLSNIQKVVMELIYKINDRYKFQKVNLFGLRIGADIAIKISEDYPDYVNNLILIEPIVIGKRYLAEQRLRRTMFYKINNIYDVQEKIIINGKTFEDHQGYPISVKNLQFLNDLDLTKTQIMRKNIFLVKLNTISSRKSIGQFKETLEKENKVFHLYYSCDDFWSSLEPINTIGLTYEVTKCK